MKVERFQRYMLVSVIVATLGLAGCSSSNTKSAASAPRQTSLEKTPAQMAEIAKADYTAAQVIVGAFTAETTNEEKQTAHMKAYMAAKQVAAKLREANADGVYVIVDEVIDFDNKAVIAGAKADYYGALAEYGTATGDADTAPDNAAQQASQMAAQIAAQRVAAALRAADPDSTDATTWDDNATDAGTQLAMLQDVARKDNLGAQIAMNLVDAEAFADALRDHDAVGPVASTNEAPTTGFDLETTVVAEAYGVEVHRRGTSGAKAEIMVMGPLNVLVASESHHTIDGDVWSSTKVETKPLPAPDADDPPPTTPSTSIKDEVTVYTNIGTPRDVRIGDFGDELDQIDMKNVPSWTDVPVVLSETDGIITLMGTEIFAAWDDDVIKLTKGDGEFFLDKATRINSFVVYDAGSPDADTVVPPSGALPGMFYGVSGEYRCTTGACTTTRTEDGGTAEGTWTFVPKDNPLDAVLTAVLDDADYLTFGYWLRTTTDEDGAATYQVQTFTDANQDYDEIQDVVGEAAYDGKAGGLYTHEETPVAQRGGGAKEIANGTFIANVHLDATFGGTSSTLNAKKFTIEGTVDNFLNDKGNSIDEEWSVSLKADLRDYTDTESNGITTRTPMAIYDESFSGTAEGHGSRDQGSWIGQFHGPGPSTGVTAPQPTGVTGEFNANFTDGQVVGAFGADLMTPAQ